MLIFVLESVFVIGKSKKTKKKSQKKCLVRYGLKFVF